MKGEINESGQAGNLNLSLSSSCCAQDRIGTHPAVLVMDVLLGEAALMGRGWDTSPQPPTSQNRSMQRPLVMSSDRLEERDRWVTAPCPSLPSCGQPRAPCGLPSDTGTGTVFQGAGPALGSLGAAGRGSHVPCHLLAALSEAELMKHLTLMF